MNLLATLALLLWAPLSIALFALLRPQLAAGLVLVGGMLFLPEGITFDLPALPPVSKQEVACLCALFGCLSACPQRLLAARPGRGPEWLVGALAAAMAVTVTHNPRPLFYGPTVLPGLAYYEVASTLVRDLLAYGIPFFLGRALYRSARDLRDLLLVLTCAGLVYAAFVLVEVRLSPQFHNWFYGEHQTKFYGTMRLGGWRPMVFMPHGLALALFMLGSTIAATALARARMLLLGLPAPLLALGLSAVVFLCRSTGVIVYGLVLLPLQAMLRSHGLVRIAALLALLVGLYPLARITETFPTVQLVEVFREIDEARADSLEFRFRQEEGLLAHAQERLWFGWGGFGRNRTYDQRGRETSITDGFWIILLGERGLAGFALWFALLLTPIASCWRHLARVRARSDRLLLASLALICGVYALDLLPNGLFVNLPLFLSGALLGTTRFLCAARAARTAAPAPAAPPLPDPVRAPAD